MAHLRIRLHGKVIQDLQLSTDQSYIAGRREDCDIVLENEKGISREHFKISFDGQQWQLEVLSRYGDIMADGEKVQTLVLEGKRIFFLPPYEFEYSEMSTQLVASSQREAPDLFVGEQGDGSDQNEKTFINAAATVPYVKVVDAAGETAEMFKLEGGDTWIAGREMSCDIIIRDQRVSRRQFEILRRGPQFLIIDLGSVNGTLLNGNPISSTDPVPIKSSDAISVLDNHLYFELHDPNFKARMELVKAATPSPLIVIGHEALPPQAAYPQPQYGYTPMQQASNGYDGFPESANKKFDFEKHRVKLIIGAVLLLGIAYFFSDSGSGPKPAVQQAGLPNKAKEAFNSLPPEKQILIKQTYLLSKNLYMQGKYELAKAEIAKIYELVPEYEDSKDIERLANEALEIQAQRSRQEELEKAQIELEEKVQKKVAECKTKINADYTMSQLEDCLRTVLDLSPEHPAILDLRFKVDQLMADKQAREMERQEYQSRVSRLKGLFARAENSHRKNQYLQALSEYQKVISSSLPDPNSLKGEARRNMASIQQTLKQKTDQLEKEADQAYKDQKLRDAIVALRKAVEVDPNNSEAKEKIEQYVLELRKQMMALYQEGVLEESYGNVDGGENRPGAKDKWKKIMELDIPDGQYYEKAKIKLKKYGAL